MRAPLLFFFNRQRCSCICTIDRQELHAARSQHTHIRAALLAACISDFLALFWWAHAATCIRLCVLISLRCWPLALLTLRCCSCCLPSETSLCNSAQPCAMCMWVLMRVRVRVCVCNSASVALLLLAVRSRWHLFYFVTFALCCWRRCQCWVHACICMCALLCCVRVCVRALLSAQHKRTRARLFCCDQFYLYKSIANTFTSSSRIQNASQTRTRENLTFYTHQRKNGTDTHKRNNNTHAENLK